MGWPGFAWTVLLSGHFVSDREGEWKGRRVYGIWVSFRCSSVFLLLGRAEASPAHDGPRNRCPVSYISLRVVVFARVDDLEPGR